MQVISVTIASLLLLVVNAGSSVGLEDESELFRDFTTKYNKYYKDEKDTEMRFQVFRENLKKIRSLNARGRGSASYDVTKFADLTTEEFLEKHAGVSYQHLETSDHSSAQTSSAHSAPANLSLTEKEAVKDDKDERSCCASDNLSVAGVMESLNLIKDGKLSNLSEQQIIDCGNQRKGCKNCLAGSHFTAVQNTIEKDGLTSTDKYIFRGKLGKCRPLQYHNRTKTGSFGMIKNNEEAMMNHVTKVGPISAGINAEQMQFYKSGIAYADEIECPAKINRYITIVGYGVERHNNQAMPYWIAKNIFGMDWGEEGYYRFHRGSNFCGVRTSPLSIHVQSAERKSAGIELVHFEKVHQDVTTPKTPKNETSFVVTAGKEVNFEDSSAKENSDEDEERQLNDYGER